MKHWRAEPGTCSVSVPSRAAPRRLFLTRDSEIGGQIPRSCLPHQSHIDIWSRKSSSSRAVPSTWQNTTSYYLIPTNQVRYLTYQH